MAYIGNAPAAGIVDGGNILDGSVGTSDLANGAVTTPKVADSAITTAKIAAGAVIPADLANGGAELGMRNRIINGAMEIDQRNAGAGASIGPFVSTDFRVDRFFFQRYNGTAVIYGARSSDAPPGFVKSLSAQVTTSHTPASDASSFIRQLIEGSNVADLAFGTASAKPVTLSFWVKTSVAGLHGGSVTSGDFGRSYVFTYTVNSASTWEYKTITVPGDTTGTWATDNTAGMRVNFDLGSGSGLEKAAGAWGSTAGMRTSDCVRLVSTLNATFNITGVQLEAGTVATPFERRPFGTELALCQRYFQRTDTAQGILFGFVTTQTGAEYNIRFQPEMRAAPTLSYSSVSNLWCYMWSTGGARTADGASTIFNTPRKCVLAVTFPVSVTADHIGKGIAMDGNNGDYLRFSAEL